MIFYIFYYNCTWFILISSASKSYIKVLQQQLCAVVTKLLNKQI